MSYQTNPSPVVESYERLLSDVNVGASNSALGEGTTTAELISKLRFLNCLACLFIILFHTLPILLNPIRLTLLVSSPVRLILELIVGILALFLFLVEARIPFLGEKVLIFTRKFAVGGFQCIDLNVASGRVMALMIMGCCIAMKNYLALHIQDGGVPSNKSGGDTDTEPIPDEIISNSTAANNTEYENMSGNDDMMIGNSSSTLLIILQCTVLSPSVAILLLLAGYTLYITHTFPEYAQERAYSIENDENDRTITGSAASTGPSWVNSTNVVGDLHTSGYQTVGS